ncbi:unnamed protein product [Rhizophagus irregularis]|nr:unnamed protein product [Rhizophagus irregularis]
MSIQFLSKLRKLSQNYIELLEDNEYYSWYIYGGILSLYEQDTSEIYKILSATDELLLQEPVDYLQNVGTTTILHKFYGKLSRENIKSLDFTSLPEKSLVQLIKRDDLQMKEVEVWPVWEHVLKCCLVPHFFQIVLGQMKISKQWKIL